MLQMIICLQYLFADNKQTLTVTLPVKVL